MKIRGKFFTTDDGVENFNRYQFKALRLKLKQHYEINEFLLSAKVKK